MAILKIKIHFLFFLFFVTGCVTKETHIQTVADKAQDAVTVAKPDTMPAFNKKMISTELSGFFTDAQSSKLKNIYLQNKNIPLWFDSTAYTQAVLLIKSASENGLNPDKYFLNDIIFKKISINKTTLLDFKRYAELDTLITKGIKLYCADLLYGINNRLQKNNRLIDSIICSSVKSNQVLLISEKCEPDIKLYKALKKELAKYRQYAKNKDAYLHITYPAKALKKGDKSETVILLKRKLSAFGYLPDSSKSNIFNENLETAIKKFQAVNGLTPDGIAGRYTFAFINRTPKYYTNTIKINMERCRRKQNIVMGDGIVINIPEYRLRLYCSDTLAFTAKVIVGKVKKKLRC